MKKLAEYTEGFSKALAGGFEFEKSVRMDIDELGSIHISNKVVTNEASPADCVLRTKHAVYDGMYCGEIEPTMAFSKGDLEMNGDISVALLLPELFRVANGL